MIGENVKNNGPKIQCGADDGGVAGEYPSQHHRRQAFECYHPEPLNPSQVPDICCCICGWTERH